ncbi:hypothetical protein J3F83DRAFT_750866 [Trichoderma novae-zelandiae]
MAGSEAPDNDSWLWDCGLFRLPYPEESKDFEVATIECWKYPEDGEGRPIPPTKRYQVRGFHTESMDSWLKEPIPAVNGQQPSSGFRMVAMPSAVDTVFPHLTRDQTHSFNTALGLPNFQQHYPSLVTGACGMFRQSDGSYVFILGRNSDRAAVRTVLRYDPITNVARGVFHFDASVYKRGLFEEISDQFIEGSHPLLLPLLAIETAFASGAVRLVDFSKDLYDIESQTGHGLGSLNGESELRSDYRTLVRELGVIQSRYYLTLSTISWCRISAGFIREKLRHLQRALPDERRSNLELSCQMLDERIEFLFSNIECAVVYDGVKEGMETQQTVLFNLIAQSDNLINVGLAKDSREMAVASKQDSSAMKIIALLTTFFLPGTFIASFFAMPLFDWSEPALSQVANRHFWVYWAVTGPLTLTIMAGVMAWAVWHNRHVELLQSRARDGVGNHSTGGKGQSTDENQESESEEDEGEDEREDEGEDADTEQSPERDAEKEGFRQKYSLRKILNRRKRQSATMEAEP